MSHNDPTKELFGGALSKIEKNGCEGDQDLFGGFN